MPTKRRRPRRLTTSADTVNKRIALNDRIGALHTEIEKLRRARAAVSRNEFREVVNSLRQIQRNTDDIMEHTNHLATQVTRMGQMQAEIDVIRRAVKKAGLLD
jgi:uncharacterized coiled-coil DUF342 family protein